MNEKIIRKTFKNDAYACIGISNNLHEHGWNIYDNTVKLVDIDFHDACDEIIAVYIGDDWTFVVVDNLDFDEILIFKMSTVEYYAKWELFIKRDIYFQDDHSNEWVWFNIGQSGDYHVQWQCATINGNFESDSIRVESCEWDENDNPIEIWVKLDDPRVIMPRTVDGCFDDLDRVAELVEKSYWAERDVHVEGRNSLHIHDIFDMDDVNEYGVGKALWD